MTIVIITENNSHISIIFFFLSSLKQRILPSRHRNRLGRICWEQLGYQLWIVHSPYLTYLIQESVGLLTSYNWSHSFNSQLLHFYSF